MKVDNTTRTNNIVDSTHLAKIDIQRNRLLARFKAGLITEQNLAYSMHMLSKQEDTYPEIDNQNSDALDTQIQMWHATRKQGSIMHSRAKSHSYGLTRIREIRCEAQRANYYLNNIEE